MFSSFVPYEPGLSPVRSTASATRPGIVSTLSTVEKPWSRYVGTAVGPESVVSTPTTGTPAAASPE